MIIIFYNNEIFNKCYFSYSLIQNIILNNPNHIYYLDYLKCQTEFLKITDILPINIHIKNKYENQISNQLFIYDKSLDILIMNTNIEAIIKKYISISFNEKMHSLINYKNCFNFYICNINHIYNLNITFNFEIYEIIPNIIFQNKLCKNKFYKNKKTIFYSNIYNLVCDVLHHNIFISLLAIDNIVIVSNKNEELEKYILLNKIDNILFAHDIFIQQNNIYEYNEIDTIEIAYNCDISIFFDISRNYLFLNKFFLNNQKNIYFISNDYSLQFYDFVSFIVIDDINQIKHRNICNNDDMIFFIKNILNPKNNENKKSYNLIKPYKSLWKPQWNNNNNKMREKTAVIQNYKNINIAETYCKYISSGGILKSCKLHSFDKEERFINSLTNNLIILKDNDILQICIDSFYDFFINWFPKINVKIILVTNDGDNCCPTDLFYSYDDFIEFIENQKIIHWFSTNCTLKHPKLTIIPYGLDYHTMNNTTVHSKFGEKMTAIEQERDITLIINETIPFWDRVIKCYANFHFSMNTRYGYDRKDAKQKIPENLIHYEEQYIKRFDTWKNQTKYAFVISPHGYGLDCIRTWEALCLGCIPIVKTSSIDDLYTDLPVLIINDWAEISNNLLIDTLQRFKNIKFNYNKITLNYWLQLFSSKIL